MLRLPGLAGLLWLLVVSDASAQDVRYFGVWSYTENAPAEAIPAEDRKSRKLGYWAIEFDEGGQVLGATYHGADGTPWVIIRYVENDGRVYADLFGPEGGFRARKSTNLSSRAPDWPESR